MDESILQPLILGLALVIILLSGYGILSPSGLTKMVSGLWGKRWSMHLAVTVK